MEKFLLLGTEQYEEAGTGPTQENSQGNLLRIGALAKAIFSSHPTRWASARGWGFL